MAGQGPPEPRMPPPPSRLQPPVTLAVATARSHPGLLPALAFAVIIFIWGSTFLAIRVSNDAGYDPLSAALVRLLAASVILLALARWRGLAFPRGRELTATVVAGALVFGVNFGLLYWGELTVPSGMAAVQWAVFPTLVALGAAVLLPDTEPLSTPVLAGALLAGVGLVAVFRAHLTLDAPVAGFTAILAGIAAAALASLVVKRWAHDVHPVPFNALAAASGAVALAPAAYALGDGLALPTAAAAWWSLAYLTVAGSVVAFVLWAWLLQRWPATRVSFQTVLSPLVAVVLGAAFLSEPVGPAFVAGTVLILAGAWLAMRHRRAASVAEAEPAEA